MYMSNSMKRTQIYLSREQELALNALIVTTGKRQSVLIREAVDLLLQRNASGAAHWKHALKDMQGIWKTDKTAEKRMQSIRDEFDR